MKVDPRIRAVVAESFPPDVVAEATRIVVGDGATVIGAEREGPLLRVAIDVADRGSVTEVSLSLDDRATNRLEAWCSCDRAPGCRHVAASMLALLPQLIDEEAQVPAWQRALDDVLVDDGGGGTTELCVFLAIRQAVGQSPDGGGRRMLRLVGRPGVRGARGAWIKGQVSWERLPIGEAPDAAVTALRTLHRLAVRSGYYWYGNQEWLVLDDVPSIVLWSQLRQLQQAGVALVSSTRSQHPVELSDAVATARLEVTATRNGTRLRSRLDGVPDELATRPRWLVGDPAVLAAYVDDRDGPQERIALVPFSEPVPPSARSLLTRKGGLEIDASGRERFEADYLPGLQALLPVVSPDGSFAVPARPQLVLELGVAHHDGETRLSWRWDRGPVRGRPDPAREGTIAKAVRSALGDDPARWLPEGWDLGMRRAGERTLGGAASVVFLAEVLPLLHEVEGLRIVDDGELPRYRAAAEAPVVALSTGADDGTDWFDLHATVTIEGEQVDFAALITALTLGEPILALPSGTYFPLDGPELERLRAIVEEAMTLGDRPVDRLRINRYNVDLWAELVELGVVAAQEAEWWLRVRTLSDTAALERVAPPAGLQAVLRDYQETGLSWLHFLRSNGLGGILADDMGLGKTLQTIAMMELARTEDERMAPFLIVAPTSVIGNWVSECARFAPELRVLAITETEARRGIPLREAVAESRVHVVVTSYTLFRLENDDYRELPWSGLVLDEAQQIKNHSSHGYRAARMIDVPFRLAITGTPMENNLLELWALASLVAPGLLGSRQQFTEFYRTPIERLADADRLAVLHRRLRPFLLRRTKELVAAELPPKQETVLEVELHPRHRHLYDRRFQRERQKLLGLVDDVGANRFQIFRSLTLLRQLALDPALVDEGTAPSAKLDALTDLLVEAVEEGHRVLVLSQFTRFLGAARERAREAGISHAYLDGSTADRQRVIDGFRAGEAAVFFVSLKAGGVGLNLVEADYVVLLDPWWNPAVEDQAIDRAHRIGQTRPVIVYRMVATNTIEQKVIALKEAKARLFERVLDGSSAELGGSVLTADDIRSLVD